MADPAKDQDQSMEDILQSIKRIIAEEGEPAPDMGGSDVLELTDMLADDGSISAPANSGVPTMSIDEIMAAPLSTMPQKPQATAPEPTPAAPPAPAPVAEPARAATEEELISGATLSASVAALNSLRDSLSTPAPRPTSDLSLRSGTTVEELVLESLRPLLKEWMDQNLTRLVESLVQKEISKLTR